VTYAARQIWPPGFLGLFDVRADAAGVGSVALK